jgi:hypothetical protein
MTVARVLRPLSSLAFAVSLATPAAHAQGTAGAAGDALLFPDPIRPVTVVRAVDHPGDLVAARPLDP